MLEPIPFAGFVEIDDPKICCNHDCNQGRDCPLRKMNNEPVAYIDPYDLERLPHYDCHIGSQQLKNGIPLYTHPAKTPMLVLDGNRVYPAFKTLTDEEIWELADELDNMLKAVGLTNNRVPTMLRQQQLEIEALRNQLWDLKSEPWGFDRKAQEK
jgi:hypothetical protein